VILIDTSAWIEYLRATGSPVNLRVRQILSEDRGFVICHPVRMEVLMGARDEEHLRRLSRLLARGKLLPTTPGHYDEGASLFRASRRRGEPVRKALDCLIAAHAISAEVPVLHNDGDFAVLARHTALREESVAAA
jgi:predicted nucleic acid-binding protein